MRVRIVDAFTTGEPFSGNPAGVCLVEGEWPPDPTLQAVADELNQPMTAFVRSVPGEDWQLRWFMALGEEPICGHATLAAAHVLREEGALGDGVRFASLAGAIDVRPGASGGLVFDFPAAPVQPAAAPDGLAEALGAAPAAVLSTGALRDRLAVYDDPASVRALAPDMEALAALCRREDIRGISATARAEDGSKHDVVSRFFSPADGLPEDAVTGSAHTALAPYWCDRLGLATLRCEQASARGGVLRCTPRGDRVELEGDAVTVLSGTIALA